VTFSVFLIATRQGTTSHGPGPGHPSSDSLVATVSVGKARSVFASVVGSSDEAQWFIVRPLDAFPNAIGDLTLN